MLYSILTAQELSSDLYIAWCRRAGPTRRPKWFGASAAFRKALLLGLPSGRGAGVRRAGVSAAGRPARAGDAAVPWRGEAATGATHAATDRRRVGRRRR